MTSSAAGPSNAVDGSVGSSPNKTPCRSRPTAISIWRCASISSPRSCACGSALRAQVEQQQVELERLSAFVDSQAAVLTICQETITSFMDYIVNLSTIGMLREANDQMENVNQCSDALARFNEAAKAARTR